jgi:hypothetical protein
MGLLLKVKKEEEETRTTFSKLRVDSQCTNTPSAPTRTRKDHLRWSSLEEQTIDTLLRPKLRANDGGDVFSRARRRVLVGWKAGSAKVVEIDF